VNDRSASVITHNQANGQEIKIWKAVDNANSITTHYLTRVELCPAFQKRFGSISKRSMLLRGLNAGMPEEDLNEIQAPYFIESYRRLFDSTPLDPTEMGQRRARLRRTQDLWRNSEACKTFCNATLQSASMLKSPVTKIVCVGLGKLAMKPAWYQSALQHMSVLSIASALNAFNAERDPDCAPIQILSQDPCYEASDRILVQELTSTRINFSLSDPDTLLAIDANTLVMSAFLPTSVPLMQIVADLFAGKTGEGPAMVLLDWAPDMRLEKRWYCMRNRDSPAVAHCLRGYQRWLNGLGKLEEELEVDVTGGRNVRKYWLDDMSFWLREDGPEGEG
jgi:hypothetical protein